MAFDAGDSWTGSVGGNPCERPGWTRGEADRTNQNHLMELSLLLPKSDDHEEAGLSTNQSKTDDYSTNMESVFHAMEPKARPTLKVDISKANARLTGDIPNALDSNNSGIETDLPTFKIVDERGGTVSPSSTPRPHKLFTVINYGKVGTEQVPPSPATASVLSARHSSSGRQSGASCNVHDTFDSQNKLSHWDRRSSSFNPGQIRPRIRLVSASHSFDVDDNTADDILSINSRSTNEGLLHTRRLSYLSAGEYLPEIVETASRDVTDHQYAVETVRGSGGHMSKTLVEVARRGRLFARRKTGRLVMKDGTPNITLKNIKTKNQMFMLDIFTTVLDMKWRWVLFLFCLAFGFSWLGFAGDHTLTSVWCSLCQAVT